MQITATSANFGVNFFHGFQVPHTFEPTQQFSGWCGTTNNKQMAKKQFEILEKPINRLANHYDTSYTSSSPNYSSSNCCSSPSYFNLSYWNFSTGHHYSRSNENDRQIGLGIVLGLCALAAGFFVGKELGVIENINIGLSSINKLKRCPGLTVEQIAIAQEAKRVLGEAKNSAAKSLIAKIALTFSLVIAAVGAFVTGGGSLIATGLIGVLLSGLSLAIQAGVNYSTGYNENKLSELRNLSQQVNNIVNG